MTAQLPRLDPYLASIGEPLEDVSRVVAAQPFRSTGPSLDRASLAALTTATPEPTGTEADPALVDAGLLAPDGTPTAHGRLVAGALTQPDGHLRVEASDAGRPRAFDAYLVGGLAVVLSGPSPAGAESATADDDASAAHPDESGQSDDGMRLDLVDAAHVPGMIAAWVGLGPAWSLATSPEAIPERVVLARADDADAPPPADADPHLLRAWQQPWCLWTFQGTGLTHGRVMVNAGASGHFALTRSADGGTLFRAVPSAVVWTDLVHLVAEVAAARGAVAAR
ncbi:hypothetical protein [Cellulomonas carbonis]|uniref:ESX secretion-associated protein EspG n=1 Tax=Cellulomonas carbonis T26 TaxID=947969 RepID=A0A0A0BWQ3_9CELL|nr:hypothetical protein [Cellulomonas carbonis]KGM11599.1 hypothetical protein N868_05525 [Cellulomonas carbonis T26]GGC06892.1 hypothetical protein GCM10010972_20180 [Cellulomonas carbonis]